MENVKFAFEDLKVYEKTLDLVDLAYDTSSSFPKQEMYGLISQLNRAAVSIALNIVECSGDSDPQFNRFLQIAINSVKECVVCSTILVPNGNSGESRQGFSLIPRQGVALRKCLADIFSERASWRIGKASRSKFGTGKNFNEGMGGKTKPVPS